MMKPPYNDDEARGQTLDELMQAMQGMDAKRIPGMPSKPQGMPEDGGLTIAILPGGHVEGAGEEEGEGDEMGADKGGMPDENAMAGMDPRLAELIRKHKSGAL